MFGRKTVHRKTDCTNRSNTVDIDALVQDFRESRKGEGGRK
jgi:hypothetical protein